MKIEKSITMIIFFIAGTIISFAQEEAQHKSNQERKEAFMDSVIYTCSMHPEVQMNKLGKCPE